jgi:hypothetical protein
MSAPAFTARRVTRTYRQTIDAAPERVFPLLCPVREAEWLDGWRYSMIYSVSGLAEEGAVFSTPSDGEDDTIWVVTRHDPAGRQIEFTRFTHGSRVCVLRVGVRPGAEGRSFVDIAYTYTSLTPAGHAALDRFTERSFLSAVRFWEQSMNHWLATGARLARAPHDE